MRYTFNYWTGTGIGEVWTHTVKFYPLTVNAPDEITAIQKVIKKASKVSQYNDCYYTDQCIPVINETEDKIGVAWLKEGIVKWEGDTMFWKGNSYEIYGRLQSFKLRTDEYKHSCSEFAVAFTTGRALYSYKQFMIDVFERFKPDKNRTSLFETQEQDLDRYFYKQLERLVALETIPIEERNDLRTLLTDEKYARRTT
jgi:hypothetical protein